MVVQSDKTTMCLMYSQMVLQCNPRLLDGLA